MDNDNKNTEKVEISPLVPESGVCDSSDSTPRGLPEGEPTLPCLNSNISIENAILSTNHLKTANALSWNVKHFADRFGLENLGFLTLTFKDHITSVHVAQKRLNSLLSNCLKKRYPDYVGVLERMKSGRIHYHFLVNARHDIRTGLNFEEIENRNYRTANANLRSEWAFLRENMKKYRFGRTELLPVKTSSEAIGRYVGKYIAKHIGQRQETDKNARLVRYSKSARMASTRFMFHTEGSKNWRAKASAFAHMVCSREGVETTPENLRIIAGKDWAYSHRAVISQMPVLD